MEHKVDINLYSRNRSRHKTMINGKGKGSYRITTVTAYIMKTKYEYSITKSQI